MPTPRATFRPHERINDPKDFRRAFERKRSASDAAMVVYGVENGRDYPRLGISVGRKKVRRAVARNRIKRLLREAFRLGKGELPPGLDLVVVPRGPALTFEQARHALAPGWAQVVARAGSGSAWGAGRAVNAGPVAVALAIGPAWARNRTADPGHPALPGHARPTARGLRAGLPVRAQLQPLHDRGLAQVRALEGPGQGDRPGVAVPPVGSRGLRSALSPERLAQVVPEIVGVFQADREAQQARCDPRRAPTARETGFGGWWSPDGSGSWPHRPGWERRECAAGLG